MSNLLEKEISETATLGKGFGVIGFVIGLVLAGIVIYNVGIPVIKSAITSANLTGNDKTIANTVPTLLGVVMLVLVAAALTQGM